MTSVDGSRRFSYRRDRPGAITAQTDARARVAEVGTCVVSTDPPVLRQHSLRGPLGLLLRLAATRSWRFWPDECATLLTPKADELIADQYALVQGQRAESTSRTACRRSSHEAAPHMPILVIPRRSSTRSRRPSPKRDGVASTGWETFLHGLLDAGFIDHGDLADAYRDGTGRSRETGSSALASSVVLACAARKCAAPMATRGEFIGALRAEMEPAVRLLQVENIAPVDLAQSAMGPGIAIFSRYAKVVEADGSLMTVGRPWG